MLDKDNRGVSTITTESCLQINWPQGYIIETEVPHSPHFQWPKADGFQMNTHCTGLCMFLFHSDTQHMMWSDIRTIYSISTRGLEIFNVLATSKSCYQKGNFWLEENRFLLSGPETLQTVRMRNREVRGELWAYLPLLVLFCCQWLQHRPQTHWKKLEYFIKLPLKM